MKVMVIVKATKNSEAGMLPDEVDAGRRSLEERFLALLAQGGDERDPAA